MRKFYLSSADRKIGGVCGGLASYFNLDSLLVRIIFIILFICCGAGLLAYLLIWLLAPRA